MGKTMAATERNAALKSLHKRTCTALKNLIDAQQAALVVMKDLEAFALAHGKDNIEALRLISMWVTALADSINGNGADEDAEDDAEDDQRM